MSALAPRFLLLAGLCGLLLSTAVPTRADETRKGRSGTAFVVHKDGLLVTCAHVVRGAMEIEVRLGKDTFPAKVIAADQIRDLAVLQVKAKDLKPLVMRVEPGALGQEVRAVGFPLTMALGEGMKMTRGTFSGYGPGSVPPLMIDVPINSGNSGGPLVNERGEVVGMISSKIVSSRPVNVGFAVAIPDVQAVLEQTGKKIKFEKSKKDGKALAGPELASKVAPSVALVFAWGEDVVVEAPPKPLPTPEPPMPGGPKEGKVAWELTNATAIEITVVIDGPETHRLVIAPGKMITLLVPPGEYRLAIPGPNGKNLLESLERIDARKMTYRTKFAAE